MFLRHINFWQVNFRSHNLVFDFVPNLDEANLTFQKRCVEMMKVESCFIFVHVMDCDLLFDLLEYKHACQKRNLVSSTLDWMFNVFTFLSYIFSVVFCLLSCVFILQLISATKCVFFKCFTSVVICITGFHSLVTVILATV